ncbi:MAG TPA: hypothetical protein ENJ45_04670, partial [Phaeodactylibacter sp.]|nr:hypothetical protein [Phaeodactylibacter sp.]
AILKVDLINRLLPNHGLLHAILIAGKRRLSPILLTSLTTICALSPILFAHGVGAELQKPLALAIIGGLCFSTLASIFFVPICYAFFHKYFGNNSQGKSKY